MRPRPTASSTAQGGVYLVGTWLIGDFDAQVAPSPIGRSSNGYTVVTYPQLFPGRDATFADGHAWVMPAKERTPQQREAVFRSAEVPRRQRFRMGAHRPPAGVRQSSSTASASRRCRTAATSRSSRPSARRCRRNVQRQFPIQDIIGEEMAAAITGHKSDRRRARRRRASRQRPAFPPALSAS